jgi:hypothetical protein
MVLLATNGWLVVRQTANHKQSTYHRPGVIHDICTMQSTGDLTLIGPDFLWDSQTAGHNNAYLEVTDAGHAIIYDADGTPIWDNGSKLVKVAAVFAEAKRNIGRLSRSLELLERVIEQRAGQDIFESEREYGPKEEGSGVTQRLEDLDDREGLDSGKR